MPVAQPVDCPASRKNAVALMQKSPSAGAFLHGDPMPAHAGLFSSQALMEVNFPAVRCPAP